MIDIPALPRPQPMRFLPAIQSTEATTPEAWCFGFIERDLLMMDGDTPMLLPVAVAGWAPYALAKHYLGRLDGTDCWALAMPQAPDGWHRTPLRAAMTAMDAQLSAIAGRAAQVLEWERTHRFCGVCGTATTLQPGERARICPACHHAAYPRLTPAMMALVWRPGELLLARSPHYARGMYSALAGFVEAGESLEDCIHREVAEEVAVSVTDLHYYGSQSWPFPNSLMVAYTARWTEGEIVPQESEIEDARWFALDALPNVPPRFSIAGHLIRDTVEKMRAGTLG